MDKVQEIQEYLNENEIFGEVAEWNNQLIISIEWGDWKKGHLWCKVLMGYIGFTEFASKVTDENGSDTYSAIHYFQKTSNYDYYRK